MRNLAHRARRGVAAYPFASYWIASCLLVITVGVTVSPTAGWLVTAVCLAWLPALGVIVVLRAELARARADRDAYKANAEDIVSRLRAAPTHVRRLQGEAR